MGITFEKDLQFGKDILLNDTEKHEFQTWASKSPKHKGHSKMTICKT